VAYYKRIRALDFYKERQIRLSAAEKIKLIFGSPSEVILPFIDIDITTYCNLRCKKCAKCIPYFQERKHYSADEIEQSLRLLTDYTDRICFASIIGGEPLLNPELERIIRICAANPKIEHLELTTNGTIVPDDDVLQAIKAGGVTVHISEYDNLGSHIAGKREALVERLEAYGIPYEYQFHKIWLDFGEIEKRRYSKGELNRMFIHCPMNSCTVYNNKVLYRCGKASYLAQHGMTQPEEDRILMESIGSKKEMRKAIKGFYSIKHTSACSYCESHPKGISAAEQLEKKDDL
jgi:hypothetical protein